MDSKKSKDTKKISTTPYLKDPILKEMIKSIIPPKTRLDDGVLIDSFVDALANLSPISINISDAFYKTKTEYDPILGNKNLSHISNVQAQMNDIYLNDFWNIFNKYSKDYIISHYLEDQISYYSQFGTIDPDMDFEFFKYFNSMFTEEKYLGTTEFNFKKGTRTAIEYAYKSVWKAKTEGIFRTPYSFTFDDGVFLIDITDGSCINPDPPECTDGTTCDCTEAGKNIGTWAISDVIGTTPTRLETPYTYSVTGSLLPIFFNTIVKDLSHPVGFGVDYKKTSETYWEDMFNLKEIEHADTVAVKSLCYEGDCNIPNIDYYVTTDGSPSITNSLLDEVKEFRLYLNAYKNFNIRRYLFKNKQFLLEYIADIYSGAQAKTIVEYYANDFSTYQQLLPNNEFDTNTDWSAGDRWTIAGDGFAVLSNTSGTDDILTQSYDFKEQLRYVIEIDVAEISGAIQLSIHDNMISILSTGKHLLRYTNYNAGISDIILDDKNGDSTAKINYISLYEDVPNTIYRENTHSSVQMENYKKLPPVVLTKDEMDFEHIWGHNPTDISDGDYLNTDLGAPTIGDYPIIGNHIAVGFAGSSNDMYSFSVGCYDPVDWEAGKFPPYNTPDACCIANEPYNPPTWSPGDPCILGALILNNPNLQYCGDELSIEEINNKQKIQIIDVLDFTGWTIVSGNATIVDGVISQDGTEESVIEKALDTCASDGNLLGATFNIGYVLNGTNSFDATIVNGDGTDIETYTLSRDIDTFGILLDNIICDDINRIIIRLTLPIDYQTDIIGQEIYKY